MPAEPAPWYVYLLECRNGSYYAGISNDVDARFQAHLAGKGAKYTRAHPPVKLLAMRAYEGTETIQALILGREITGYSAFTG